jgi:hypothetical protein
VFRRGSQNVFYLVLELVKLMRWLHSWCCTKVRDEKSYLGVGNSAVLVWAVMG